MSRKARIKELVGELNKKQVTSADRRAKEERNDAAVGVNIRRYRAAAGISQTELANKVGVTFQQIQKYEKGTNACPPGRLRQISGILGITMSQMFGEPPQVDGELVPLETIRAHQVLTAISHIKDGRVKRAIEDLILELSKT